MITTAGTIMDFSAALMNDQEKQVYTYDKQLAYLKMAFRELIEKLELADVPVTHEQSTVLVLPIGTTTIGYDSLVPLPADLIQIRNVWTSRSQPDIYNRLIPVNYVPGEFDSGVWSWSDNKIHISANAAAINMRLDYIASLYGNVIDENSMIGIANGESFMQYRTASLCAQYIGENIERANSLRGSAEEAFDRTLGIETKARQTQNIRRRPFRSGWKMRAS